MGKTIKANYNFKKSGQQLIPKKQRSKDIKEILVQNLPENDKSEQTADSKDSKRTTNSNKTADKS